MKRSETFGYLGLLLLAGAGAVRLLVLDSGAAALVLAAAGAAALIAYLFTAGPGLATFLDRRATREGGGLLATTAFTLGALVLVNLIAGELRWRRDLTAEALFTLAPETESVLRAAPEPPVIWVFHREGGPEQARMRELAESARLADPRVEVHVVDPQVDPARAYRFGIQEFSTVVEVGERRETFVETDEESLAAAIQRASQTEKTRVGVLNGHGEAFPDDEGPEGLFAAGSLLHRRGYEVRGVNLLQPGGDLRGAVDVLVVPGPRVSPSPVETDSLLAFVDAGGRLLLLLDPARPVTLDPVLDRFGLRFEPEFVEDPGQNEPQVLLPTRFSGHPATRDLGRQRVSPVLLGAGEFTAEPPAEGRRTADLFASGSRSALSGEDGSPRARVLAMAAELDRPGGPSARLVAVGDLDFALNANLGTLGNGDLFLGAVRWLAEREDVVSIRPRPRSSRPVVVSRQQGRALMVLLVGLTPLAVLAAGAAVWWRRR